MRPSAVALTKTISVVLAIIIGLFAASRPLGALDRVSSIISLGSASAPDFWIAVVGILFFAVELEWLPTSGTGGLSHWVLPIMVLALRPCGLLVQVVRASMINVLSTPYIRTARAKGAKERYVFL